MFETARGRSMRLLAAALLALSTVLVGFAHRPPASVPRAVVAGLVLPDGTVADLCHAGFDDGGDDRPGRADHAVTTCDACRLTDAPGLAATTAGDLAPPLAIVAERLGHGRAALVGSLLPAPRSRGPPRLGRPAAAPPPRTHA